MRWRAVRFHLVTSNAVALEGSSLDLVGLIVMPYMDHTRSMVDEEGMTANMIRAAYAKFGNCTAPPPLSACKSTVLSNNQALS